MHNSGGCRLGHFPGLGTDNNKGRRTVSHTYKQEGRQTNIKSHKHISREEDGEIQRDSHTNINLYR